MAIINGDDDDEEQAKKLEKLKFTNMLVLSGAMFVVFTGYFTMAATGETIVRSYNERTGNNDAVFRKFFM